MSETYVPKYGYSIEEWIGHFDYFFRELGRSNTDELIRYFAATYPNHDEARWKCNRFGFARDYLLRHLSDFEKYVVRHENKGLISRPIVEALWMHYGRIPDEHLQEQPETEMILEFAAECE